MAIDLPGEPTVTRRGTRPLSVLLLEPHDDTREMYQEFLAFEGFVVSCPLTIAGALELAPAVDVVVTETRIEASGDGIALVRELRASAATEHLPILVVSSRTHPSDVARARAAGCDLFLKKPCLPSDLSSGIRGELARHQA
jgi:DNA-binding response OmpR family regulator